MQEVMSSEERLLMHAIKKSTHENIFIVNMANIISYVYWLFLVKFRGICRGSQGENLGVSLTPEEIIPKYCSSKL